MAHAYKIGIQFWLPLFKTHTKLSKEKYDRGFSGVHNFFVKPEIRLNPSPVNTKIVLIPNLV